jgi:hypothetical protein
MASMTDPMVALVSFQQALLDGEIRLQRAELDPDLFVFLYEREAISTCRIAKSIITSSWPLQSRLC